eukprot:2436364-Alexandrium_andersonii.AAC.1
MSLLWLPLPRLPLRLPRSLLLHRRLPRSRPWRLARPLCRASDALLRSYLMWRALVPGNASVANNQGLR